MLGQCTARKFQASDISVPIFVPIVVAILADPAHPAPARAGGGGVRVWGKVFPSTGTSPVGRFLEHG